jgi:hypothetical protein
MPGAYAHITLANTLKETSRLEQLDGFPNEAIAAVLDYFKFCELGAVSPDYPYLVVGNTAANRWADLMHYTRTGDLILAGIAAVRALQGEAQRKCLAWLLGYAAHVAADVTIHPVVELKVGTYAENKTDHRICEMNQDAYIFQRLNLGEIGLSEHLDSGIGGCCVSPDDKTLDYDISTLWTAMLRTIHAGEFAENGPDPALWHRKFLVMVDTIAEEGNRLLPLARHVAVDLGLTYPAAGEIMDEYLHGLAVPTRGKLGYDEIFDRAVANASQVWRTIASNVYGTAANELVQIGNWNLDTGRDDDRHNLVFWG